MRQIQVRSTTIRARLFNAPWLLVLCLCAACAKEPAREATAPASVADARQPAAKTQQPTPEPAERHDPPTAVDEPAGKSTPPPSHADATVPNAGAPGRGAKQGSASAVRPATANGKLSPLRVVQHRGARVLALTPDGKNVAIGYDDGSIKFHDVASWSVTRDRKSVV